MSSQQYWRSVPLTSLRVAEWQDGFTVFQPGSGQTYFLNPLGMQLLVELQTAGEHGISAAELNRVLLQRLQLEPTAELLHDLQLVLYRFDERGLAFQVRQDAINAR